MNLRKTRNIGVPAQTIVNILIEIVLNLIAELIDFYLISQKYRCRL